MSPEDLAEILKRFMKKGLLKRTKDRYSLRGLHAE